MKCVIYARRSQNRKDQQIYSIQDQLTILQRIATERGFEVVEIIQENMSAKKTGRPEFGRMIKNIQDNLYDVILCWSDARLARNMPDGASLIYMLQNGVLKKIITPTDTYDESTDTTILAVKFGVSSQFSRTLSKNVKRSQQMRVEQGYSPGSTCLGYRSLGRGKKEPDEMAHFVKKAFELYDTGRYSTKTLWAEMKRLGLRSKAGNFVTHTCISKVLKNPFYYGLVQWGEHSQIGVHKPIIKKQLFDRVQQRMAGKTSQNRNRHFFAYSNFIYFNGSALRPETQKGKNYYRYNPREKQEEFYFIWKGKKRKTIREDFIDEIVSSFFQNVTFKKEWQKILKNQLNNGLEDIEKNNSKYKAQLKAKLTRLDSKIKKLSQDYYNEVISGEFLQEMRAEIKNEKIEILEQLQSIETEQVEEITEMAQEFKVVLDTVRNFSALKSESKRIGIELFFKSSEVRAGHIILTLNPIFSSMINLGVSQGGSNSKKPLNHAVLSGNLTLNFKLASPIVQQTNFIKFWKENRHLVRDFLAFERVK